LRIVVASNNAKKRAEIAAILDSLQIDLVPPGETRFVNVIEDGDSFAANAARKAEAFAQANDMPALADDSGLSVDALNGAPGVYSSRFAGEDASDTDNCAKLLHDMDGKSDRTARFVCALHLAFPDGRCPLTAEGTVEGRILERPGGAGGFGYDPLFFCPEIGKSFAAATPEEKASVSHRGRALLTLSEKILDAEKRS
jgi:XTP/dITP diphosphohydrolase